MLIVCTLFIHNYVLYAYKLNKVATCFFHYKQNRTCFYACNDRVATCELFVVSMKAFSCALLTANICAFSNTLSLPKCIYVCRYVTSLI